MDGIFCCILFLIVPSFILSIAAFVRANRLKDEIRFLREELANFQGRHPVSEPRERALPFSPIVARTPVPPPPPVPAAPEISTPPALDQEQEFVPEVSGEPTPEQFEDDFDDEPAADAMSSPEPVAAVPTPTPAPTIIAPMPVAPKPGIPLEQRLIRLAVGVGGLALALAGIFLVKVAFSHNYLNPTIRVLIGTLFGAVVLTAGVARRRKEPAIAQALSAAGIADLFACFLAATNLYHLIPPTIGFLLLAATTALAVLLSLRQGPFVAFLGLVGGFLTPALINTGHPSALSLFGYLFLLHVGLISVTRARRWAWIAALTVLASLGWVVLWLITQPWNPGDGPVLGAFLLLSTAVVAIGAAFQETAWHSNPLLARILTYITLLLGCGLSAVLLARSNFSNTEWLFLGLLSAGCFTLARLRRPYEPFAWFASTFILVLLAAWGFTDPADLPRLQVILPAFGILFSLAAYGCLWGSRAPQRWAALSIVSVLSYTLLAYTTLDHSPRANAWAFLPLSVAIFYCFLSLPILRQRERFPASLHSILITGILLALSFAPPMCLENAPLTATWSLLLPLTALLATRLRLNDLSRLLLLFAALLIVRLINPAVLDYSTGPTLFWNPLIWAYLPTLASFLATLFLLERASTPLLNTRELSTAFQSAISLIALLFLSLFIHRIFHPDTLAVFAADLPERSTYPSVWLLAAFAFFFLGHRFNRPVLTTFGHIATYIGLLFVIVVQVLLYNPLWTPDNLGAMPIFNLLLYTYGLPAVLAALLAFWLHRDKDNHGYAQFAGIVSLLLLFVLTSLEIRHAFNGPVLAPAESAATFSFAERATYPALWILLAFPLLAFGRHLKNRTFLTAGYIFSISGLLFAFVVQVLWKNPFWTPDPLGDLLLFNGLLYAYGLPAFLAAALAWWLSTSDDPAAQSVSRFTTFASLVFLFLLVSFEIRHGFHGPILAVADPVHLISSLTERGTYTAAWLLLAIPFLIIGRVRNAKTLLTAGYVFAIIGLLFVLIVEVFVQNPLWTADGVGFFLVVNRLLYVYGLPALISGALARWLFTVEDKDARAFARISVVMSILLTFVLVSLEVRQGFQGSLLNSEGRPQSAEMYAYSAAWGLFGTFLLVAGILTRGPILRWASLLVMLVTILKVFLFDTANLSDIFRVLSFAGLGILLILLAFLYHYFVFPRRPRLPRNSRKITHLLNSL